MKESCDGGTAARVTVLAQLQLLFSHYRYCLCMPLLTMHSPVIGAAVNPEALTQDRAMLPRPVTTPEQLIAATERTAHSCCIANPNGAKLNIAGTIRRRFERPHGEG
jgi:hypothetical protein